MGKKTYPSFSDHADTHAKIMQKISTGQAVPHDRSQLEHTAVPCDAFDDQGIEVMDVGLRCQAGFNGHSPQSCKDPRDIDAVRAPDAACGALDAFPERCR
jgi:hypothetical protein